MALGDIGMFLPSESQYGTPGAYGDLLRSEATKRAVYLSSIDQFYAQLNESQRQFDKTLGFNTETRDLNLDYQNRALAQEKTLTEEGYQTQKDIAESGNKVQYAKIASDENITKWGINANKQPTEFGGPTERDYFNLAKGYLNGGGNPGTSFLNEGNSDIFMDYYGSYSSAQEMSDAAGRRNSSSTSDRVNQDLEYFFDF